MTGKDWHPKGLLELMNDYVSQEEIYNLAKEKGWWAAWPDPIKRLPESLMLITSELAECLEEYRNGHGATEIYYRESDGKPEGIPVELADAIIRIRDTAESLGIDLEAVVKEKHEFNKTRPYQHGNKRA